MARFSQRISSAIGGNRKSGPFDQMVNAGQHHLRDVGYFCDFIDGHDTEAVNWDLTDIGSPGSDSFTCIANQANGIGRVDAGGTTDTGIQVQMNETTSGGGFMVATDGNTISFAARVAMSGVGGVTGAGFFGLAEAHVAVDVIHVTTGALDATLDKVGFFKAEASAVWQPIIRESATVTDLGTTPETMVADTFQTLGFTIRGIDVSANTGRIEFWELAEPSSQWRSLGVVLNQVPNVTYSPIFVAKNLADDINLDIDWLSTSTQRV